ncbi:protein bark beetle-like [Gordionus sp. m RMFG-2023]|uniref:protein bark beetle-like n=1 Tax=Gordionus sp. m RMFG-2023 TaxID=3053472 RepID=UPI0031FD6A50
MGQHTPNTRFNKIQENVLRESGTITLADSPYYVSEDIIIPSKASVYIEPGVEIRFAPGVGIDVYGTLIAKGTPQNRILMSSLEQDLDFPNQEKRTARLTDGSDLSNGRLQIFYKNKWRTICTQSFNWSFVTENPEYSSQRYWNQKDITIACRGAGFDNGTFDGWLNKQYESDHVLLGSPSCFGDEKELQQCANWKRARTGKGICGEPGENYILGIRCWNDACLGDSCFKFFKNWRGIFFKNSSHFSTVTSFDSESSKLFNIDQNDYNSHINDRNRPLQPFQNIFYNERNRHEIEKRIVNQVNWQHNRSRSRLDFIDLTYAGRDRYGKRVAAIKAEGYAPALNSVNIKYCHFTALHYDRILGSPVIRSSNIAFNQGDGINLNARIIGNVTIEGTRIANNYGRGIIYSLNSIIDTRNFDFCSRPYLGLNQVYPVIISGNQHSQCKQIFLTKHGYFTIHFSHLRSNLESLNLTSHKRAYIEIRDGSESYDKLIAKIYFKDFLSPQSIVTTGPKVSMKFSYSSPLSFQDKLNDIRISFSLYVVNKNSRDLDIKDSIINDNGMQGILVNGYRNAIEIMNTNISSNHHIAGVQIESGAGNILIENGTFESNHGSAVNITYSGGLINITKCTVHESEGYGVALNVHNNRNDDRAYLNPGIMSKEAMVSIFALTNSNPMLFVHECNFMKNRKSSIYLGNYLREIMALVSNIRDNINNYPEIQAMPKHYSVSIIYNKFLLNYHYPIHIDFSEDWRTDNLNSYNMTIFTNINNNTFEGNLRPGLKFLYHHGMKLKASIGSNIFSNNSKGAIIIQSYRENEFKDTDTHLDSFNNHSNNRYNDFYGQGAEVDVHYNYFIRNSGNFVMLIGLISKPYYGPGRLHVTYNYFVNNIIRSYARSLTSTYNTKSRSQIHAVVAITGCSVANLKVERNHFANAPIFSDYELGTRCKDRLAVLSARFNWFESKSIIDQLQINEIYDKVFDQKFRYNLAKFDIHPFLRTSNLNGPTSNTPFTRNFLRVTKDSDYIIGGMLEDRFYLTREYSPYTVNEDIFVTRTGELRVDQGVEIRFENGVGMFVEGKLFAIGLESAYPPRSGNILFLQKNTLLPSYFLNEDYLSKNLSVDEANVTMKTKGVYDYYDSNSTTSAYYQPINDDKKNWETILQEEETLYRKIKNEELEFPKNVKVLNDLINEKFRQRSRNILIGLDGRLHVHINGSWGTVCIKGWTIRNAMLACKSMGLVLDKRSWKLKAPPAVKGRGWSNKEIPYPWPILMSEVNCDESDNDITECNHELEIEHSCSHDDDVALKCLIPKWAGIRFGFFSQKSEMNHVIIQNSGIFDMDTGETAPALTLDLNIHDLKHVELDRNYFGGLRVIFNDYLKPQIIEHSRISFNEGNGVTLHTPGVSFLFCSFSDNSGAGIHYNPYLTEWQTEEVFKWNKDLRYPNAEIISMEEVDTMIAKEYVLQNDKGIYLYFGRQDYATPYEKNLNISTFRSNVLTAQLFGSIIDSSKTFKLEIIDHFQTYKRVIDVSKSWADFPFISITWNLNIHYNVFGNIPHPPFILYIKAIKIPVRTQITPYISILNSTVLRNSEGASITLYDSLNNKDIFTPFPDLALFHNDLHLRYSNLTFLLTGTNFEENSRSAITLNSPFHNTQQYSIVNATIIIENCNFKKNLKIWSTNDLYCYDSNNIWTIIMIHNNFHTNFAGLDMYFPFLISDYSISRKDINRLHARHSLWLYNNTFENNRNFSFKIQGAYLNMTLSRNVFQNNVGIKLRETCWGKSKFLDFIKAKIPFGILEIEGANKIINLLNNTFEGNKADLILKINIDSNDGPIIFNPSLTKNASSAETISSNFVSIIKYNYFRHNSPLLDYSPSSKSVTNHFSNYLIGIFGIQPVTLNYNAFQINDYKHCLISGLKYKSALNIALKFSRVEHSLSYPSIDARYNYWDTHDNIQIRSKIFDFYEWNSFVNTIWYPYLSIPDLDNSPHFHGSYEPQHFDPDSKFIGGYLIKDAILLKRPQSYIVIHDITIPQGVTLMIGEGAELNFAPNIGILVYGSLKCEGTSDQKIIFDVINNEESQKEGENNRVNKRSYPNHYFKANATSEDKLRRSSPSLTSFGQVNDYNYLNFDSKFPFLLRMAGGILGPNEGFLEYLNSTHQQWFPYCDTYFSGVNAKIICGSLGFSYDNAYHYSGWRSDIDTFWIDHVKYWAHPLDCHGNEKLWQECHPRLINNQVQQHTKCYDRKNHIYLRCQIKDSSFIEKTFWGNIRFMNPFTDHFHYNGEDYDYTLLRDIDKDYPSMISVLNNVIVKNAGHLHGMKSSAIQISNEAQVDIDGLTIEGCAWHGMHYFNPSNDIDLISRNDEIIIRDNRGLGINSINLLDSGNADKTFEDGKKTQAFNYANYLDPSLFGSSAILDICDGGMPITISPLKQRPLLVGYAYDDTPKKRCLQIFKISNQKTLGFRIMHANIPSSQVSPFAKTTIIIYKDESFIQENIIVELNSTNINSKKLYESLTNKLGIFMESDSGDFTESWVGEIISFPSSIYYKQTTHHLESLTFKNNLLGAVNFVSVGQTTPNLQVEKNRIINNGFHSHNFSSPLAIITMNVQNIQNLLFVNNFVGNNYGNIFQLQSFSDSSTMSLNGIINNNVFSQNSYGAIMNLLGSDPSKTNQNVKISECLIVDNYSPLGETISIKHLIVNMSRNIILNNVAVKNILAIHGFEDVIPHIAQSFYSNHMYNNTVMEIPGEKYLLQKSISSQKLMYSSTLSTIFVGNSFQEYIYNYFDNPKNDYELSSNYKYNWDLWEGPIMAQHNWWGTNYKSAIHGRIRDKSDDKSLIQVKSEPYSILNASFIQNSCPPGWANFEKERCFLYVGGAVTFKEAINFCTKQGGTLPYLITSTKMLKEFVYSRQYPYSPQMMIWVQKQPSAYLNNYDKCYALVDEVIEEVSCKYILPFICEINPIMGLFVTDWIAKPYNIIALILLAITFAFILVAIYMWRTKSRRRKTQAFNRRNSLRSSIRSNRSIRSIRSIKSGSGSMAYRSNGGMPSKCNSLPFDYSNSTDLYSLGGATTLRTLSEAGFQEYRDGAPSSSIVDESAFNTIRTERRKGVSQGDIESNSFYDCYKGENMGGVSAVGGGDTFNDSNSDRSGTALLSFGKGYNNLEGNSHATSELTNVKEKGGSRKTYADIIYDPVVKGVEIQKMDDSVEPNHYTQPSMLPDEYDRDNKDRSRGVVDSAYDSNESKDFFSDRFFYNRANNGHFPLGDGDIVLSAPSSDHDKYDSPFSPDDASKKSVDEIIYHVPNVDSSYFDIHGNQLGLNNAQMGDHMNNNNDQPCYINITSKNKNTSKRTSDFPLQSDRSLTYYAANPTEFDNNFPDKSSSINLTQNNIDNKIVNKSNDKLHTKESDV